MDRIRLVSVKWADFKRNDFIFGVTDLFSPRQQSFLIPRKLFSLSRIQSCFARPIGVLVKDVFRRSQADDQKESSPTSKRFGGVAT
jgi:hypothetical protein